MIDDIWEVGGKLAYALFVVFFVAAVYLVVTPLIDPSAPFAQVVVYAESMGTLALGLLVGSLLLAASIVLDKLNSFGGR